MGNKLTKESYVSLGSKYPIFIFHVYHGTKTTKTLMQGRQNA